MTTIAMASEHLPSYSPTSRFWPWLVAALAVQITAIVVFVDDAPPAFAPETVFMAPSAPSLSALDVIERGDPRPTIPLRSSMPGPDARVDFTNLGSIAAPTGTTWSRPGDFMPSRAVEKPPRVTRSPRPNPHPEEVGLSAAPAERAGNEDETLASPHPTETAALQNVPLPTVLGTPRLPIDVASSADVLPAPPTPVLQESMPAEQVERIQPSAPAELETTPAAIVEKEDSVAPPPPGWLIESSSDGFAIQLAAFANRASALEFVGKNALDERPDLIILATQSRGRQWHAIIVGPFSNKPAAVAAAGGIAAEHAALKPWIRSIGSLAATRVK